MLHFHLSLLHFPSLEPVLLSADYISRPAPFNPLRPTPLLSVPYHRRAEANHISGR